MQKIEGFPQIDSGSLYLRPFSLDDTDKIFRMSLEKGMKDWIPDQVYTDLDDAREVLEFLIQQYQPTSHPARNPIVLGVCLNDTSELIGHVGLSPYQEDVEIGYAIEDAHQKKGYATEAIRAMTGWAFPRFSLSFIVGLVSAQNIGSCRVLEKAGFALTEEKERMFHGKLTRVKKYQLG